MIILRLFSYDFAYGNQTCKVFEYEYLSFRYYHNTEN